MCFCAICTYGSGLVVWGLVWGSRAGAGMALWGCLWLAVARIGLGGHLVGVWDIVALWGAERLTRASQRLRRVSGRGLVWLGSGGWLSGVVGGSGWLCLGGVGLVVWWSLCGCLGRSGGVLWVVWSGCLAVGLVYWVRGRGGLTAGRVKDFRVGGWVWGLVD